MRPARTSPFAALFGACLATLAVTSRAPAAEAPRTHESRLADKWRVVHLDNGLVEIGLAPEMGGRLMLLRRSGQPWNCLRQTPDAYLRLTTADLSPYFYGLNYGGLRDVHSPGWPGLDFNDKAYTAEVAPGAAGEAARLTSEAVAEGVRSRRTFTLAPGAAVLRVDVTLTNQRPQYLDLMCRLNGEYAVGAGRFTTVFPDAKGALRSIVYVLGREEGRGFQEAHGGWLALVDEGNATAMLLRYPADQVKRFLLWTGAGALESVEDWSPEMPEDYFGFVGINLMQEPRETPPGGTLAFWQEYHLVHGLSAVDLVAGETLAQVQLVRPVGRPGEPCEVAVGVGRATPGAAPAARLRLLDPAGAVAAEGILDFGAGAPGEAQWRTWTVPAREWGDGEWRIELGLGGQTASVPWVVRGADLAALAERRAAVAARVEALGQRAGRAPTTHAAMARARLADADARFAVRDLGAAGDLLTRLEADVARWLAAH